MVYENLPEEWDIQKLGSVVSFSQGLQIPPEEQFPECKTGYVRFVRIIDHTSEKEPPRFINHPKSDKYFVNNDDVVMIRYGSLTAGKVVKGIEGIIANNMFRVIPKETINKGYLYYFLSQKSVFDYLRVSQSSSTMPAITFGMMESLNFLIPPLQQQQKIAYILSALDDKIELNNHMTETLETMAKALFKSWFVDFEPFVDGAFEESELGKIPKGWKTGKLSDIADVKMGLSPSSTTYNEEGIGTPLLNGAADFQNGQLKPKKFTTDSKRNSQKDDIVFCIRATIGLLTFSDGVYSLGRGVAAITPKQYFSEYIFIALNDQLETIKNQATGSVIVGLKKEDITDLKILIPNFETIKSFWNRLSPIFERMNVNTIENNKLISIRDTLLPKLMSGEIEV